MQLSHSDGELLPEVSVRAMTRTEYDAWREGAVTSYAQERAAASGRPVGEVIEFAAGQFSELLPDGPDTAGTWLLSVLDEAGAPVGVLWIGRHPDRPEAAFVYDIEIAEPHRGRGLGRATMHAAERVVLEAGIRDIGLNVFGPNERARRLYDSLGYQVVATQMTKRLLDPGSAG